ncbi:hypothetical protein B0H50_11120 [Hallerella porci]|uniref:Lipoprotein n=2 Tax=Hallerella porci TaxID=1945871 RepID=A0ABX5LLC7_9BACT|nr:hypothetical protein B0H50_11120 [Hallerella porci]
MLKVKKILFILLSAILFVLVGCISSSDDDYKYKDANTCYYRRVIHYKAMIINLYLEKVYKTKNLIDKDAIVNVQLSLGEGLEKQDIDKNVCSNTNYKYIVALENNSKQNGYAGPKYKLKLDTLGHVKFSLFDANDVEKKYDFDVDQLLNFSHIKDTIFIGNRDSSIVNYESCDFSDSIYNEKYRIYNAQQIPKCFDKSQKLDKPLTFYNDSTLGKTISMNYSFEYDNGLGLDLIKVNSSVVIKGDDEWHKMVNYEFENWYFPNSSRQ